MKNMLKEAAILFAITLIAGCLLGLVYQVTKDPIAQAQEKAKEEASKEVFADANSFRLREDITSEDADKVVADAGYNVSVDEVSEAVDASGNVIGYVITVTDHEGYGGDIQFSMGIRNDGTLNGISILSISETAGLGMNADSVLKPQFENKKAELFSYTKTGAQSEDQIDAISGATITTNAIVNGVNAGLTCFKTMLMGGGTANE